MMVYNEQFINLAIIIIKMDREQGGKIPDNSKSIFESKVSLRLSSSIQPRRMEQMNLLIIEKISDVVAAYYENIDKLRTYFSQIQSLVDFNKRLITILGQFEAQEEKLIKRLRRMQEVNVEYMRQYCQMKGREFKMPNLPEHKSIFANYSLQDIEYSLKIVPPVVEVKYKEDLISILKQSFLTRQDKLLSNIQQELQNRKDGTEGEQNILWQVRKLIKEYHQQMSEFFQAKPFDLLKKRSIIRRKVEEFYDSSRNQSEIKPNYLEEDQMVSKIVNLQSKVEQISFETLQEFLHQEKELCNCIERQRIQLEESYKQKQKDMQRFNRVKENQINKLQQQKNEMESRLFRIKSVFEEEIKDLKNNLVEKELRIEQIQNLIAVKNQQNENVQDELTKLKLQYNKLVKKQKSASSIPSQKQKEAKSLMKLNSQITAILIQPYPSALQQKIKTQHLQLAEKQKIIQQLRSQWQASKQKLRKYSERVALIEQEHKKQMQSIAYRLALFRQENDKINRDKQLVENLASQVCQAIRLISSLSFNPMIKKKLQGVLAKLQQFLEKYQRKMQWDINKQSPGFFSNFSHQNLDQQSNKSYRLNQSQLQVARNSGYSFDIANLPLIRQSLNIKQQKSKASLAIQRSVEIMVSFLKQQNQQDSIRRENAYQSLRQSAPSAKKVDRVMSLELSNENEQKGDKDEFENLRRLYQQSVQCLQMQEKKTKSMEAQYQKYVEMVMTKQKFDPEKFNLEKQLVYLTRLSLEQQETIEEERKSYNEIFKEYHESFKSDLSEKLNSLRGRSMRASSQNNNKSVL